MQARLRVAAPWLAAAGAVLLAGGLAVQWVDAQGAVLALLMGVSTTFVVGAAAAAVARIRAVPGDHQVARFIEERLDAREGDLSAKDVIVTAVEVVQSRHRSTGAFDGMIVADAARRLRSVSPDEIVTRRAVRRAASAAGSAAALLLVAGAVSAPSMWATARFAQFALFPGTLHVSVMPGSVRIPAGAALRVRAAVHGPRGQLTKVSPALTLTSSGDRRTVQMVRVDDFFEYSIEAVDRTFSYQVSAGGARSAAYTVTALVPPRVARIDVSYAYPSFAGLTPREERDGGDILAPAGTRVRLRIHADRPAARGEVILAGAPTVAARSADDSILEADLVVSKDDSYRVNLADGDGLHSRTEGEYFIRLMNDRPPTVRITRPSADQQISPLEEIAIEAVADDDHGIVEFDFVYAVSGGPQRPARFSRVTGSEVERVGSTVVSAEALKVRPGDVISYYARARDVGRGKRSTQATSDIFFLEVKPFNQEFAGSETQAGQGGGSQIDSLVDAQKQIIASTWNIERRSGAGRSPGAVQAVVGAQSMLKRRTEEIVSRARRTPGRIPMSQRTPDPQAGRIASDAMAGAAEAMGNALLQLETDRTREALAHEMAALNRLLQAQAEVRRREVARQQANGAGNGGNRSGQDLSALFDRELQRQQQTNYETPRAAQTPPENAAADAAVLDRIRDLARRQEDLSRRQRELSGQQQGEEARRQLQRLTREQEQLREEAESLARRLASARRGAGGPGGDGKPSAAGVGATRPRESLEAAADRMRAAAEDMRNQDAPGAAKKSTQAAAQLREIGERARMAGQLGVRGAAKEDAALRAQREKARALRSRLERLDAQVQAGPQSGTQDGAGQPSREHWRDLAAARQALEELAGEQQFTPSSPGTEAFKQDRSSWESLRRDLGLALERYEGAVSGSPARKRDAAGLHAGGSQRAPEGYEASIARYFESLARVKKRRE